MPSTCREGPRKASRSPTSRRATPCSSRSRSRSPKSRARMRSSPARTRSTIPAIRIAGRSTWRPSSAWRTWPRGAPSRESRSASRARSSACARTRSFATGTSWAWTFRSRSPATRPTRQAAPAAPAKPAACGAKDSNARAWRIRRATPDRISVLLLQGPSLGGTSNLGGLVAWGGFALGLVVGAVANRTNFCTMGAVSDVVNMGSWGRMRMWLLAIAVAILGAHALNLTGLIDLSKSFYVRPNLTWLSYIVGGLLFGIGMTLGSGCGSKTLVRIGAGNLKSLVVYVFLGIAAYMTLRGLLGAFRVGVLEKAAINLPPGQDLPSLFATWLGLSQAIWLALLAAVIGGAMIAFAYASEPFRSSFDYTLGGVVTGLVVVGGWYVSGHLGYVAEDPETLQE